MPSARSAADDIGSQLEYHGLAPFVAEAKAKLFQRCYDSLPQAGRHALAYFVPGRVEVLGKHTDYAGGSSLVAAVDRGFCMAAVPQAAPQIVVSDVQSGQSAEFPLDGDLTPSAEHWSNYPMTVARRVARNFPGSCRGVQIAFASDLPPAAGMSSSSALMIGVFFALADANDIWNHPAFPEELNVPEQLAGYLGTIENGQSYAGLEGDRGVGTFGGSEDHTAIVCSQPGRIRQYAYCPVRLEREYDFPAGYTIAVASSGIVAEKTGAARERYNQASGLAAEATRQWRAATGGGEPHLAAIIRSSPAAVARLRKTLASSKGSDYPSGRLVQRLEHFLVENQEVIPAAGQALTVGDMAEFGRQVDRSQHAAEQLLGNQVPETIHLAATARGLGAIAASTFGAGFGGSVWALVPSGQAAEFLDAWQTGYQHRFPQHADQSQFFTTTPAPACFRIET